jgi:(p)ppGpp synthase/HD superfamily hydrolase
MLSSKLGEALSLAVEAHDGQVRKSTTIPYVAHPMAVASLALEFGADEDQAIAALLHDVLEDGGAHYAAIIRQKFGPKVLGLVEGCTDGVPDQAGQKGPWKERKAAYLDHLRKADDAVLLVSGSDKLHNARAIVSDLRRVGESVFDRFTASKEETLWYYRTLAGIFSERGAPVAVALNKAVDEMESLAGHAECV